MLKIAICDDNAALCEQLEAMLLEMQKELNEQLTIATFYDAERLWRAIQEKDYYDLIFLDIELPGENGLTLARKIHEKWVVPFMQIVYVTANSQYMPEAFDAQPVGFLTKPLEYKQVRQAVDTVKKRMPIQHDAIFEYTHNREMHRLPCRQILYLQVRGKYITIATLTGDDLTYRGNLSQAMRQLEPCGFIRINQSQAINSQYVATYNREKVRLRDDTELTISQRCQKDALRQLRGE